MQLGQREPGGTLQGVDGEARGCKHYRTLQRYCLTEERQRGAETISVKVYDRIWRVVEGRQRDKRVVKGSLVGSTDSFPQLAPSLIPPTPTLEKRPLYPLFCPDSARPPASSAVWPFVSWGRGAPQSPFLGTLSPILSLYCGSTLVGSLFGSLSSSGFSQSQMPWMPELSRPQDNKNRTEGDIEMLVTAVLRQQDPKPGEADTVPLAQRRNPRWACHLLSQPKMLSSCLTVCL